MAPDGRIGLGEEITWQPYRFKSRSEWEGSTIRTAYNVDWVPRDRAQALLQLSDAELEGVLSSLQVRMALIFEEKRLIEVMICLRDLSMALNRRGNHDSATGRATLRSGMSGTSIEKEGSQ